MSFEPESTWIGVASKTGFSLGPGYESTVGVIWNCNDFRWSGIRINALRVGLGVGASTGATLILVFNALNRGRVNNTEVSDWGVNVAVVDRLGSVLTGIRSRQAWASVLRLLRAVNNSGVGRAVSRTGIRAVAASGDDLNNLRNLASMAYTVRDVRAAGRNNDPTAVAIDIPLAGLGAEISVNWTTGRAEIF